MGYHAVMRFALLALAALIGAQEPAGTPIWWSLKKGQKVRYEFNHRLVKGDAATASETDLTIVVALEGGDLGADRANALALTFERIALTKSGHGEREDYDSARDKEPPKGDYPRVLSKCVGKTLNLRIAASGRLVTFDEFRKMIQAAVDAWPDLKGRKKWGAEGVDVAARRLEWLLRAGFETPKGGPAAVGDSWETTYDDDKVTEGRGRAVCTSTLKEIRGGTAVVDQVVKFDFPAPIAAGIKEASGKGTYAWDVGRGMLKTLGLSSRLQTLKGDVTHRVTVALLGETPK